MKTKRYQTLELVCYSRSNRAVLRYFDDLEEAMSFASRQRDLHPMSKKLNGTVFDNLQKKYHRI